MFIGWTNKGVYYDISYKNDARRRQTYSVETHMQKNKNQLDATYCFITLLISSTCFENCYAHHQGLTTIVLITTWTVRFFKDE